LFGDFALAAGYNAYMHVFEKTVERFIVEENLIPAGASVLLGVSGGADSMAMLNALFELCKDRRFDSTIFVAHINHQLRGELANRDEAMVIAQAIARGIKFETARIDVKHFAQANSLSLETAARLLRREALIQIADKFGCQIIATAHHRDDNAETLIHRLKRGTGYRGLAGIWPSKKFGPKTFIRPLLCVSRTDIMDYVSTANIPFNHDHTNEDTAITRNFIRHKLLPALQAQAGGDLSEKLFALSTHARKLTELLEKHLHTIWPQAVILKSKAAISLDRKILMQLSEPLKIEVLRMAITNIGVGEQDLTFGHYRKAIELLASGRSGSINLPGPSRITIADVSVTVALIGKEVLLWPAPATLEPGESIKWNSITIATRVLDAAGQDMEAFIKHKPPAVEWFDLDKINGPLRIRARKNGDRFVPFGLKTEKKIGKFLTDSKLAQKTSFIIEDQDKIIYLAPLRPSDLARITSQTKRVLEITVTTSQD